MSGRSSAPTMRSADERRRRSRARTKISNVERTRPLIAEQPVRCRREAARQKGDVEAEVSRPALGFLLCRAQEVNEVAYSTTRKRCPRLDMAPPMHGPISSSRLREHLRHEIFRGSVDHASVMDLGRRQQTQYLGRRIRPKCTARVRRPPETKDIYGSERHGLRKACRRPKEGGANERVSTDDQKRTHLPC
jgi:hypothetical protein